MTGVEHSRNSLLDPKKSENSLSINRYGVVTCLSVTRSRGRRFSFRFTSLTPIWLWHCDTQFPYRYRNHPRLRIIPFWLGFESGIPRDRRLSWIPGIRLEFIPWDPSMGFIPWDPRLPFGIPWDLLRIREFRGYSSRILLFTSIKISTTKLQNTRLKLAEPFRRQIQF